MSQNFPLIMQVNAEEAGKRLDQFLTRQMAEVSRARMQQLIAEGKVTVNGALGKASLRLHGGEQVEVSGEVKLPPLRAMAEDIPLDVIFEDEDVAVINKPAGMMVHVGAGATEDERNRGTLVNALLHRFASLSGVSGEMRPGIVHRLDKATSGLIIVAKNDSAHRKLAEQFSLREVKKTYLALVHGWLKLEKGLINSSISRDRVRRTRMTTRRQGGREAITEYKVSRRIDSCFGKFTFLELKIGTGRTHQIRVHLSSLGHPVVGDTLYGAPREMRAKSGQPTGAIFLSRNFLHAAALEFRHPRSEKVLSYSVPLPSELQEFLQRIAAEYNKQQ